MDIIHFGSSVLSEAYKLVFVEQCWCSRFNEYNKQCQWCPGVTLYWAKAWLQNRNCSIEANKDSNEKSQPW